MDSLLCSAKDLTEWIQASSAVIVAGAAIIGLNQWKKNRRSDLENEVARKYYKAVLAVREGVRRVRNPFVSVAEMIDAHGGDKEKLDDNLETNKAVYSKRWEYVRTALTELDVVLLEAEVIWDNPAVEIQKDLRTAVTELRIAVQNRFFTPPRFQLGDGNDDIIYEGYSGSAQEDAFNQRLNIAIGNIKTFLRPYISFWG